MLNRRWVSGIGYWVLARKAKTIKDYHESTTRRKHEKEMLFSLARLTADLGSRTSDLCVLGIGVHGVPPYGMVF
jgi:hypothetical protein